MRIFSLLACATFMASCGSYSEIEDYRSFPEEGTPSSTNGTKTATGTSTTGPQTTPAPASETPPADQAAEEKEKTEEKKDAPPAPPPAAAVTYAANVQPVILRSCLNGCHAAPAPAAMIQLDTIDTLKTNFTAALGAIEGGRMPAATSGRQRLTADEIAVLKKWRDGNFMP